MNHIQTLGITAKSGVEVSPSVSGEKANFREAMVEIFVRLCATLVLSLFTYSAVLNWLAAPERITLALFVVSAFAIQGLALFARVPKKRDWRPVALFFSIGVTYYFLAVQLAPGTKLIPESAGAVMEVCGIVWQLFAKASLRRSFGILPANRGVVSCGAYRFIRHPMYLGYFIADLGFLLTNFGVQNLLVCGGQFLLQIGRIVREERLLCADETYRAYKSKVRYRVIPGIF
jgi:protein-S-isoprenylcysteine O-methyltransferase Ste14